METGILEKAAQALAAELTPPPRIIRVSQAGPRRLLLHLEWRGGARRGLLVLDLDPATATLHLAPLPREWGESPAGPMTSLLGDFLTGVEAGKEPRIRLLRIRPRSSDTENEERTLVAEWTGVSGGFFILDSAGRILESLAGSTAGTQAGRETGALYSPPLDRRPARGEPSLAEIRERLASLPRAQWPRALTRMVRDLPLLAAADAVIRGEVLDGTLAIVASPASAPASEPVLYRFPRSAALGGDSSLTPRHLGLPAAEVSERFLPSLEPFAERDRNGPDGAAERGGAALMEKLARRHELLLREAEAAREREAMVKTVRDESTRLVRLRKNLLAERGEPDTGAQLRRRGEAIVSHMHALRRGEARLVCPDWRDPEGKAQLLIELDPAKSPSENAQIYFHKARRWERGEPHRIRRLAEIDRAVGRLSVLEKRIEEAETPPRPSQFRNWLDEAIGALRGSRREGARMEPSDGRTPEKAAGPSKPGERGRRPGAGATGAARGGEGSRAERQRADGRRTGRDTAEGRESRAPEERSGAGGSASGGIPTEPRAGARSRAGVAFRPRSFTTSEGWNVLVGRSNEENDYLTHKMAHPEDIWFHAHGVPGSHVVLRREGRKSNPSARTLEEAASIAAFYSKARHSKRVPVIYTLKKYVRKPRGAKAGLAVCMREKSVLVPPRDPSEGKDPEWMEE